VRAAPSSRSPRPQPQAAPFGVVDPDWLHQT
jgi:hypothetical protein